jgi:hypothetical protein
MLFVFNRGGNSMQVLSSLLLIAALSLIPVVRPVAALTLSSTQGQLGRPGR